jgi:arginyl-tRNA synthetase
MDFKEKVAEIFTSIEPELSMDDALQLIEIPPNTDMGDYAVPCFKFAKKYRKSPAALANEFVEKIGKPDEFEKIESAGPYVNFFVNKSQFAEKVLRTAFKEKENFGRTDVGQGKTVIVEFSSPNIAKPFHIGHIRSTLIGNAIHKIYTYLGYNTVAINHLGDYGTQFGMLISAYKKWATPEVVEAIEKDPINELMKLYVRYNKEIETHPKYRRAKSTITAFCSYHAMLNAKGNSFISSNSNTSFSFRAINAREYESLHWPASRTLGIPPMSPKFSLLYLYFAQPAVKITVSSGKAFANSV